ncbi:MAG: transglutaminase [Gammaproteobacteria bacterium]|nr:transglutaminase [Gammaproteobacteria bacterium]
MLKQLKTDYSPEAYRRGLALNDLLEDLSDKSVEAKLRGVNRFFNQFQYGTDIDVWGKKEYWARPYEFVGTQQGDCEDFVIAKYFALRQLGIADNQLYLTYVLTSKQNTAHMVLSYFKTSSSVPLILDNSNPRILQATQRKDLNPIYSFNAHSLFLNNTAAGLGTLLPKNNNKNRKWTSLLADIRKEGYGFI